MTDGPDWAETLGAVKKVPGKAANPSRIGMDQVAQWQQFQQQRTGADVAVAVGGVDTGDNYDGWGHFTEWASDQLQSLANIWNGWFGSGGTGTPAQTQYVIESIKDAVINGYTVHTITADETNWTVPSHTEFVAILIGGGQNAQPGYGSGTHTTGGLKGLNGSYIAQQIDLTGITALDMQVGTAGNKSYVRVANATPHTGAVVLQSPDHGSAGGIATSFGYTSTSSTPGNGGDGEGIGTGHLAATAGTSSAAAVGGAAGTPGFFGNPGGNGGNVSAGATTKCGGGGGGGGGSATGSFQAGGSGGAGGYPGGGGGGGGCGSVAAAGSAGPGAAGVIWLFYR